MKIKHIVICLAVLAGGVTSCSLLDVSPDGRISLEEVFRDPIKVGAFLNSCYNNLPIKNYRYNGIDANLVALSDEGWSSWDGGSEAVAKIYSGQASASSHPLTDTWTGDMSRCNRYWDRYWEQIRLCNQFLENIDNAAVESEEDRDRYRAEAHALRAYFYSELIKWFGDLPVVTSTFGLDANYGTLERIPARDVVDQVIVPDCDAAINSVHLPWRIANPDEAMRMTKATAHAIKSEMLLFAASPLFTDGNADRWEKAYDANLQAVKAMEENGYELYRTCSDPGIYGTGTAAAYREYFSDNTMPDYSSSPRDRETIWAMSNHFVFQMYIWHVGYVGGEDGIYACGTCPSQELVDAFDMANGEPVLNLASPYQDENHLTPNFNAGSGYNEKKPYENRDPRFYQIVLYNGAPYEWDGTKKNIATYEGGINEISLEAKNNKLTRTGYYHCKSVRPTTSYRNQYSSPSWRFYRLGEIYLNLAEAAAMAGHEDDARAYVNKVRDRVGMPGLPETCTGNELVLRVRNERRIELAWEENRYYDLRRWSAPDDDLETCRVLTGMKPSNASINPSSYIRYRISDQDRGGWESKFKFLPIPSDEAARMYDLTGKVWQNPGW
ncbi:MAG: RagB/SusD family nutrient uptake outer membrane protein [Bacteroidales bacterium]|nr:RagB/SusD family nutrient uptake outer membrane protein [Bacteroidales bacterium]